MQHLKREAQFRYGEELQINWEKTREIEQEEKYVKFNRWCDEQGIIRPACRYPVAFGEKGELTGVSANHEIGLGEAYIFVPVKCIINESKFRRDPQIGHLLKKYPELFRKNANADHIVVIFFLMHEMSKGEDSYWYHYL